MAFVRQQYLFSWRDCEDLGDLERLKLVVDNMPDEKLTNALQRLRGNGRDKHSIKAMWNSLLAGIVYEHKSIESLRRELARNPGLREMCGFDPLKGGSAVPSSSAYSRFLENILEQQPLIDEIFHDLVRALQDVLPDLGKSVAFDGKAIQSLAQGKKNSKVEKTRDRRRDGDADWGVKKYYGLKEDGTVWEKVKSWFGFRLHLIVDATYELPISYQLTKASTGEQPVIRNMFDDLAKEHPTIIDNCEYAMGDKGYDSKETISKLWRLGIKPVIDIKNMWKDGEKTRQFKTRDFGNLTYDYKGKVYCHCPVTGDIQRMAHIGFEKSRETLKFSCPAKHYGFECKGSKKCPLFNKSIRVPLDEDKRIFTPLARSTHKWKRYYNKRSSVERVNSRLDVSFGFEKHFFRGLNKMKMRCGLALCVMLSIALGRIRQNKEELARSLVKAA